MHTQTRSKKIVSELYRLSLSVSYDRILELENQIATSFCNSINETGLVCPHQLRHGLFTVGVLDNLDHNPSSTTSRESFHGTGISLFQFPTLCNEGLPQPTVNTASAAKKLPKLLDSCTIVPAVVLRKDAVVVPSVSTSTIIVSSTF